MDLKMIMLLVLRKYKYNLSSLSAPEIFLRGTSSFRSLAVRGGTITEDKHFRWYDFNKANGAQRDDRMRNENVGNGQFGDRTNC